MFVRRRARAVCAVWTVVCAVVIACVSAQSTVTVQTPAGPITGLRDINVNQFLGIPYAKPPVGDLRWTAPEQYPEGPITATAFKPGCMQKCDLPPGTCPKTMSEDCLYLDVFVPFWAKPTSKLNVMVFLPGGRFEQGSISTLLYSGNYFANATETILVNVAYRLGAFGFLVTDASDINGNYGFLDQVLALEWVQANIAAFGGDPDKVTLFGQSAGGTSTTMHLTAKGAETSTLFSQAIIESNPYSLLAKTVEMAERTGKDFAKVVGCKSDDSSCLRAASASAVLNGEIQAQRDIDYLNFITAFYPWTPVVDGTIFDEQPINAIQAGKFKKVPLMLGSVYNEGLLFIYQAWNHTLHDDEYYALIVDVFRDKALDILREYPPVKGQDNRDLMAHLTTQWMFACPARAVARAFTAAGLDTYLYQFEHVASWDVWGPNFPYCRNYTCHGSELPYVFNSAREYFDDDEAALATHLATMWASFAHHGSPNEELTGQGPAWPTYSASTKLNYHFATPASTVAQDLWAAECDLWDKWGFIYNP